MVECRIIIYNRDGKTFCQLYTIVVEFFFLLPALLGVARGVSPAFKLTDNGRTKWCSIAMNVQHLMNIEVQLWMPIIQMNSVGAWKYFHVIWPSISKCIWWHLSQHSSLCLWILVSQICVWNYQHLVKNVYQILELHSNAGLSNSFFLWLYLTQGRPCIP